MPAAWDMPQFEQKGRFKRNVMSETDGMGHWAMVHPAAPDACVLVRIKGGIAQITSHQIAYLQYHNHTVVFHLASGRNVSTAVMRVSFSDYVRRYLKDKQFVKSHNAYVVNMDHVQVLGRQHFHMMNGDAIPISKRVYADVRKRFVDYVLGRPEHI